MFYCEPCRAKHKWPGVVLVSYGKCEVCEEVRGCYDTPSSRLVPVHDDNDNVLKDIK